VLLAFSKNFFKKALADMKKENASSGIARCGR